MFKKFFAVALLMALTLSACGSKPPTETAAPAPTETPPPVATEAPAEIPITGVTEVVETPTETPEVISTPSIPRPANEAGSKLPVSTWSGKPCMGGRWSAISPCPRLNSLPTSFQALLQ